MPTLPGPTLASGLQDNFVSVFPAPFIANRAPGTNDFAPLGQIWVDKVLNDVYILTSTSGGGANWMSPAGGTGVFNALEATSGNITADVGNIVATAGSVSAGTSMSATTTITAGTDISATNGDLTLNNTDAGTTAPFGNFRKSRGGGLITTGDVLGTITFQGATAASTFVTSSQIISTSSGTIGASRVASNLEFFTHPDSTTASTQRAVINSAGNFTINEPDSAHHLIVSVGATAADSTVNYHNAARDWTMGIDNSTANDDFVVSLGTALGTTDALSIDGSSRVVTAATGLRATTGGVTATAGDVTATAGNVVLSAAASYVDVIGPRLTSGTGSPNTVVSAPKGSLFMRTDGTGADEVLYVNTDGTTAWTALTST